MAGNVLIVSFTFPPSPGIGGRRWAKFAKYLQRSGYNVFVLAAENVKKSESEWSSDVKDLAVEYLPYRFPAVMNDSDTRLFYKIKYRFWLLILQNINKGNFYDRSFFWKKQIESKISDYIKHKNIDTVIVTAGPFVLSYYVTSLKCKFPQVKFIVDFRDLWTADSEITAFSSLDQNRIEHEKFLEKKTIQQADYVLAVGEKMTQYFNELAINKKVFTLPNGYDEDDFKDLKFKSRDESSDIIRLVFAGTFYINLTYILVPLFEALVKLRIDQPGLFNRLRFEFYGTFPQEYKVLINKYKLEDIVYVSNKLPLMEIYSKIKNATACLLFLNDIYNFALSTKFCEYISQGKQIIVVANKGPTAEFILENNLGYWISPANAYDDLLNCLVQLQDNKEHVRNSNFDVSYYSLENLSKRLAEIIDDKDYSKTAPVKNMLLTFDYELFLGAKSGTVKDCLIHPTGKILTILKKRQVQNAIFFVDTVYIKMMDERRGQNPGLDSDYNLIVNQLCDIVNQGHYIFPHIHPHWLDADYDVKSREWSLWNMSKYRFHVLDNKTRDELFEQAVDFIKKIQLITGKIYPIDSFRAGGWCIQPFADFEPLFTKYGIKNDFSVLKSFSIEPERFYYNFKDVPERPVYYFDSNIEKEETNGKFKEYSITYVRNSKFKTLLSRIITRLFLYSSFKSFGKGISVNKTEDSVINVLNFEKFKVSKIKEMTTIDFMNEIKSRNYKKFMDYSDYIHFISHPKMVSARSLNVFSKFLKSMTKKYNIETDYKKMF